MNLFSPNTAVRCGTRSFCCIVTTMNNYTYTYACRNIFNTITTSEHSSLEKYTSHFIERFVCERELVTEQRLQHIDPQLFWLSQPFFPVLLGCSTGSLGPSLIPASSLQLILTSCRRGYIIITRSPTSSERHNSHSIQPLDSQGHP